jgi:hypothetical protein
MPPVRDRTKYGNVGASLRRRVVVVALGAPEVRLSGRRVEADNRTGATGAGLPILSVSPNARGPEGAWGRPSGLAVTAG